jgi:hypothetical protein
MSFAYIRRRRKALMSLDSQPVMCVISSPNLIAKSIAASGFVPGDPRRLSGAAHCCHARVEHDHASIAMNVVHVYTHL